MNTYQLLDSGDYAKLEIIHGYKIIRPSLTSPYQKTDYALWEDADAIYHKNEKGGGKWQFTQEIPEEFFIGHQGMQFKIKLTPFGHIGLFPEQEQNWQLLRKIGSLLPETETLNLFAYSGSSTIAGLQGGLSLCHVDSSKGMVAWARENALASEVANKKVRWIVDDVQKFIKREVKRNKQYLGFILDPPTFGRGNKGEVWKIEKHLIELFENLMRLCNSKPAFVILSCHSSGYSPLSLERILRSHIKERGIFSSTELQIQEEYGHYLSGGFCAYFLSDKLKSLHKEIP
ncbi:MAG: class I SAM-dependent methyltransferase [Spirochaetota bacterium]